MKKFTKVMLILSACLIAVGLVLVTVGGLTGGHRKVAQWALNGELSFGSEELKLFSFNNRVQSNSNYEIHVGDGDHAEQWAPSEVQDLVISVGGAEVRIEESTDDQISISYNAVEKLQYYIENDTLFIIEESDHYYTETTIITLSVPAGTLFETATISIGGGVLKCEAMNAQTLSVEAGAGKITLQKLQAAELDVEVGAGEVIIDHSEVQNADLEAGLGHLRYTGIITGNLDAECSMGNLELLLEDTIEDHSYSLECSMGSIQLGGRSYTGLASEATLEYNDNSMYRMECAMGNITVDFK